MPNNKPFFTFNTIIFFIFIGVIIHYVFFYEKIINYGEGVLAPQEPIQKKIYTNKFFMYKGAELEKLATYKIKAKVLSKKDYGDEIRVTDLALGWGNMSDEKVIKTLEISQSNRWYRFKFTKDTKLSKKEIAEHSANTHIIVANNEIKRKLTKVHKGHLIKLKGFLVNIKRTNGLSSSSSMTRKDRGAGACENMYVEELEIIEN